MSIFKRGFRLKTEREYLSALYGLWVGIWTILILAGGAVLTLHILQALIPSAHSFVAIGGMLLYVCLSTIIFWPGTRKLIYRLASAMVEIQVHPHKKILDEKVRNNG